jgi:hypothetical protein
MTTRNVNLATFAAIALLGGCPGEGNPSTLWLALDGGRETEVMLVEFEPPPY